MEARIARLESDVGHILADVADLRTDFRSFRDKVDVMDQRLSGKIDALDQRLGGEIRSLDQRLSGEIRSLDQRLTGKIDALGDSIAAAKLWAVMLYIALAGGLFGVLARGFDWI